MRIARCARRGRNPWRGRVPRRRPDDQQHHVEIAVADMAHQRRGEACRFEIQIGLANAIGQQRDRYADIGGQGPAAGLLGLCRRSRHRVAPATAGCDPRGALPIRILPAVLGGNFLHRLRLFLDPGGRAVKLERTMSVLRARVVLLWRLMAVIARVSSSSMRATGTPELDGPGSLP